MSTEQMTFEDLCVVFNYQPKHRLLTNDETAEVLRKRVAWAALTRIATAADA